MNNDSNVLLEYFKYIQNETKLYEIITKNMSDSHIQTVSLLDTYLTRGSQQHETSNMNPIPNTVTNNAPDTFETYTNNIVRDNSLNRVASLSDISRLITILRDNIELLQERNPLYSQINRPIQEPPLESRQTPLPNQQRSHERSFFENLLFENTSRRTIPSLVAFSTLTTPRRRRQNEDINYIQRERQSQPEALPQTEAQPRLYSDIATTNNENVATTNNENVATTNNENVATTNNENVESENSVIRRNTRLSDYAGGNIRRTLSSQEVTPPYRRSRGEVVIDPPIRRHTRRRGFVQRNINFFEQSDPLINPGNIDSPVRVRPSVTQVRNGTQLLCAMRDISGNTQTQCPIDLNDFVEGDSLLKIIGCGHIFREMNLRNHFRYSATCPMCRYDIRDYVPENTAIERV